MSQLSRYPFRRYGDVLVNLALVQSATLRPPGMLNRRAAIEFLQFKLVAFSGMPDMRPLVVHFDSEAEARAEFEHLAAHLEAVPSDATLRERGALSVEEDAAPVRKRITKKGPPKAHEVEEVKRPRGRPRKDAAAPAIRIVPVGASSSAARRRGRPPGALGKKKRDLLVEEELKKLARVQL